MKYDFDQIVIRRNTNSAKWDMKDADIIPVWLADMDLVSCQPMVDAIVKRAKHGIFGYSLIPDSFYNAVTHWMKKRHKWPIKKEWIGITPGTVSTINLAIQALTQPGDKVIIQTPAYYPFYSAISNNGCHLLTNNLKFADGKYEIDFEDFKKKAADQRAKIFILCSPHNPVGRVWTRAELTEMGRICLENDIYMICDEIHAEFVYKGYHHTAIATISEAIAQNSIMCYSASKTFNLAGLRLSITIIPNKRIKKLFDNKSEGAAVNRPNTFGIIATEAAFTYGEEWLEQLQIHLKGNLEFLTMFIQDRVPRIKVYQPEGTYFVWLDCRDLGMSVQALESFMLDKVKVWFDQGAIFGEGGNGFVRIVLACPRTILEEVLIRLEKGINLL